MTDLSDSQQQLRDLAAERDAVILAHNYQRPEVQDAADFVGDSLELPGKAAATDAAVILFCGVHFMAETAKILSPGKTVLMPDTHAGCPMADMVTVEGLRALKAQHPDAAVVAYVNTSAEIKAEVDVCCTSANAPDVVGRIPAEQPIIFVPDRNLGDWVAGRTGRTNMIMWNGYCPVHEDMTATEVRAALERAPRRRAHGAPRVQPRGARPGDRDHEHLGHAAPTRPPARRTASAWPPRPACCTACAACSRARVRAGRTRRVCPT